MLQKHNCGIMAVILVLDIYFLNFKELKDPVTLLYAVITYREVSFVLSIRQCFALS